MKETFKKLNKEAEDPYTFQRVYCCMVIPNEEIRLYNTYKYRYDRMEVIVLKIWDTLNIMICFVR